MITISKVAPSNANFASSAQHSTSGRILSLALSADPNRIYAGSLAGVWRSDDGGQNFRQMVGPLTDTAGPGIFGGIYAPHIYDLAASLADPDIVLAAAADGQFVDSRDGIYRSADGGQSWELVLPIIPGTDKGVSQILFAPDDPTLVYAALGASGIAFSTDAGKHWTTKYLGNVVWHLAVGALESPGVRRIYAAGQSQYGGTVPHIWFSTDGGAHWSLDPGISTILESRSALDLFQKGCDPSAGVGGFAGKTGQAGGNTSRVLAIEPGNPNRVYLATTGGSNGPSYYNEDNIPPDGTPCNTECSRLAGEGSLWYGDFSQFGSLGFGVWALLPGPPVYSGGGDTPSGNMYVITQPTSSGFLLFFSDMSHVHMSQGVPAFHDRWHRLGGKDVSTANRDGDEYNFFTVHADPHALIITPDFSVSLKAPPGVAYPYDQCMELDANQPVTGTIWMANDGGIDWSNDGGKTWHRPSGLETLDPVNIAGLFGIGTAPALYFGCGDNDDFFSRDGGQSWQDPLSACGDCDAWFTDTAQSNRVLEFVPRAGSGPYGGLNIIYSDNSSSYPDAADASHTRYIWSPRTLSGGPYPSSARVLRGLRPIILTLATEAAMPDGDYVFVHSSDGISRSLLRTTAISSITQISDWNDTSKAQPVGPPLPQMPKDAEPVVQASGGHENPVFYVANQWAQEATSRVWKLDPVANSWVPIVPGGPTGFAALGAYSFFVHPYRPDIIYLVDISGIKISIDGGGTWLPEVNLTAAVTAGGKIKSPSKTVIYNMIFNRVELTTFAFGDAGVFYTTNGIDWLTALDAIAIPGRPESGFFDPLSNPNDRALYVELEGRSILRLGGIPGPPPFTPPPVLDLLEFAAILDA